MRIHLITTFCEAEYSFIPSFAKTIKIALGCSHKVGGCAWGQALDLIGQLTLPTVAARMFICAISSKA